jgi:hypothetical protein
MIPWGEFRTIGDKIYTPPVVAPGPHRVTLLVDHAVGSATEALVRCQRLVKGAILRL